MLIGLLMDSGSGAGSTSGFDSVAPFVATETGVAFGGPLAAIIAAVARTNAAAPSKTQVTMGMGSGSDRLLRIQALGSPAIPAESRVASALSFWLA